VGTNIIPTGAPDYRGFLFPKEDEKMENKTSNPKSVDELIAFFRDMPAQNGLPPDLFQDVIVELQRNPDGFAEALRKWLQSHKAREDHI
jgi:hypothetical protein